MSKEKLVRLGIIKDRIDKDVVHLYTDDKLHSSLRILPIEETLRRLSKLDNAEVSRHDRPSQNQRIPE